MRYASGVRALLVVSVVLAVFGAIAVITQAVLLAGMLADVIIGGAGLSDVTGRLLALAVVIAVRAAARPAAARRRSRSAVAIRGELRRAVRAGDHRCRLAARL